MPDLPPRTRTRHIAFFSVPDLLSLPSPCCLAPSLNSTVFTHSNIVSLPGVDARYPNTNQTKHCWQNYVDYHKCILAKGEDFAPCRQVRHAPSAARRLSVARDDNSRETPPRSDINLVLTHIIVLARLSVSVP